MSVQIKVGGEYNAMGETVEVTNERDGRVCVYHPEREPVEGGAYTVWRPRESVEAVAEREEWEGTDEVIEDDETDVEWNGTPRCPICSRFMRKGTDGEGVPSAQCSRQGCNGFLDVVTLEREGYIN